MRESNERVILTVLRRSPGLAKVEIARRTGLSAQTVSRLIGALEADGLIRRGEPTKGRVGQPSVPMSLNPSGAIFLGMTVGRRSAEVVATDFLGKIFARRRTFYEYPDFDEVLAFAESASEALCTGLAPEPRSRVAGLGIAMPNFLWSWAPVIGVDSARMANWKVRDLGVEAAERLPFPVFRENDATATCRAERVFGEPRMPENALCFFVAFFIGAGLSLDRAVFSGTSGNAAGFGPLRVPDRSGQMRQLMDVASLCVLERELERGGHDTRVMWSDPEAWDFPVEIVQPWLEEVAHGLAHAIVSAQTILDVEAILINGWMPRDMTQALTFMVREQVSQLDLTGMLEPDIRLASAGADAGVLGAASMPLSQKFLVSY